MAEQGGTPSRTSSGGGEGLRADAPAYQPGQVPRRESNVRPIRTSSRQGRQGDVLASLDAIPFTPSQGVCTPSPTNMAAMWMPPHPFFQHPWSSMATTRLGSPGPSSGGSDSSLLQAASQPGTPGGGMFGGAPVMWGGFMQPMPYSPTALQIAAASGALGSDPSTPVRGRSGTPRAAGASGGPFLAMMPGSPMVVSPGQMMFTQYFGTDAAGKRSQSPPESKDSSSGSGDEADGSEGGMSSNGSGQLEVSEAAHQIATAMCAAQQLPGEPPQQLLELASLLHAYGLVSAVPSYPAAAAAQQPAQAAPLSPDSRRQQARQRQKSAPKLNADGSVRLNARQRRTLRRAQERAMKALLEAQTKAHGISSEQAAAHLASMGVTSMLLGSPQAVVAPINHSPPMHRAGPPLHMAPAGPFMAPLSPGPPPMMAAQLHHDFSLLHGMQQAAAAAGMVQFGSGGFDAGFGLGLAGGEMPLHGLAAAHSTPPPQYAGNRLGPGGYHGGMQHVGSGGGFRRTPGSGGPRQMSRFAPPDAVAAF